MPIKQLIIIETDNVFIQGFQKALKGQFMLTKYAIAPIVPEFLEGEQHMLSKCHADIATIAASSEIAAFYVDLSISDTVIDKQGIVLGMEIRKKFPMTPIFCVTNKNRYDSNFDNLSDATLEDFDGVFEKNYLVGIDFSEERLDRMLAKAHDNRKKAAVAAGDRHSPGVANTPYSCDVAFITALFQYEFEQVRNLINIDHVLSAKTGTVSTKVGTLKNSGLKVLVDYQQKMGMVDASILATSIAIKYRPKLIIMTGVCASRTSKGIKVGDIIIPAEVYAYQSGKLDQGEFKPYPHRAAIDTELISRIRDWKVEILRQIEDKADSRKDKIKRTELHFDMMACGSLVLKTDGALDDIAELLDEKTVAVEMESYGIARTCDVPPHRDSTKGLVIKASMDGAGADKSDEHKEWAAQISAGFAYHFLLKLEAEGYFNH